MFPVHRGARRRAIIIVGVGALALVACGPVQSGPFPPTPADATPTCGEPSVEVPDGEDWVSLYRYAGNPINGLDFKETRVLRSANPRITITRSNAGTFDWTSSDPAVALIIQAGGPTNIYYWSPGATQATSMSRSGDALISLVDWCQDPTPGTSPTTAMPPTTWPWKTTTTITKTTTTITKTTTTRPTKTTTTKPPAATTTQPPAPTTTEPPATTTQPPAPTTTGPPLTTPPD